VLGVPWAILAFGYFCLRFPIGRCGNGVLVTALLAAWMCWLGVGCSFRRFTNRGSCRFSLGVTPTLDVQSRTLWVAIHFNRGSVCMASGWGAGVGSCISEHRTQGSFFLNGLCFLQKRGSYSSLGRSPGCQHSVWLTWIDPVRAVQYFCRRGT